jgi:hypothetical protein
VKPLGVSGREHLADRSAGVVCDEIDVGQLKRVAAIDDESGQARQGEVLIGRRGSVTVQR